MTRESQGIELSQRLRRTSDEILARLDELEDLEIEKRRLEVGTPAFLALADRIGELSQDLYDASQLQKSIAQQTADVKLTEPGQALALPIEDVPTRDLQSILAEWRDVERRLPDVRPDSEEGRRLQSASERLRMEYRASFEVRRRASKDRP